VKEAAARAKEIDEIDAAVKRAELELLNFELQGIKHRGQLRESP
jgi:hypothetical protein